MVLNASLCRDMIRNLDEAATSKRPTGSGKGTEVGDPIVLTELYPYVTVRHVPGVWWAGQREHVCGIVGCRYVFRAPTSMSLESLTPEVSKYQTVMLQLHMGNYSQFIPPQYRTSHDATDKDVYMWWTVSVTPDEPSFSSGLVFNIMSDKIAPSFLTSSLGSGSILAVYATLVLAIGRLVRSGLGSPTYMIMFNELKNPDDLMELVEVRCCWWLSAESCDNLFTPFVCRAFALRDLPAWEEHWLTKYTYMRYWSRCTWLWLLRRVCWPLCCD